MKLRALSWSKHVAAGHTPFRKDCLVCQQASAKDQHHRRSKLPPRAGVLSMDLGGPFHAAPGLHRKTAKYLLVGAFTGLAPNQGGDDFEELEIPEATPTSLLFQRIHFLNWDVALDTEEHSGGLSAFCKADKMADLSDNPPGW